MATQRFYSGNAQQATLQVALTPFAPNVVLNSNAGFPTSFPFVLKLDAGAAIEEKVLVTASAGGTSYSVQRGFDGTFAGSHSIGATATHVWSALDASDFSGHMFSVTEDDHTQYLRTSGLRQVQSFTNVVPVVQNRSDGLTVNLQSLTFPAKAFTLNSRCRIATLITAGSADSRVGMTLGGQTLLPAKPVGGAEPALYLFDFITTAVGTSGAIALTLTLIGTGGAAGGEGAFSLNTEASAVFQTTLSEAIPPATTTQFWTVATVTGV